MPNQAKQRFLDLTVKEVSLVDTPANEVEFLVVKRLETTEDQMAVKKDQAPAGENTDTTKAQESAGAEVVQIDADDSGDAVVKALGKVSEIVQSIVASKGKSSTPATETAADKGDDEEEEDTEKAKKANPARKLFKQQLQKNGIKGDALTKAMEAFDAEAQATADASAAEKPTNKAKTEHTAAETAAGDALEMLSQAVNKAKTFTPARQKAIKAAADQLLAVLAEINGSESAASSAPASENVSDSGLTELTKQMTKLAEGLAASVETTKGLVGRLDTIEKARQPSTSLTQEGNDSPTEVKKSFWSGVL